MPTKEEFEELKAKFEEQRVLYQKLHDQINPPPRPAWTWQKPDPTEGMSMPANALRAMIDAVPASVMADIRGDARRPNPMQASSSPLSTSSAAPSEPQRKGTGWQDEIPFGPQPGIEHVDRLVDAQDRRDLIENAQKLAAAEIAMKEAAKKQSDDDA